MKRLTIMFAGLFTFGAMAGDLTANFQFDKRPPKVALVYFADDKGLSLEKPPLVDQKNKQFLKKVVVTTPGSTMHMKNSDDIAHNVFADDAAANVNFDIGLAEPGTNMKQKVDWREDTVVKIGCKIHPQMRAWVANISSRYYEILEFVKTEPQASCTVKGAGADLKKVRVWLPGYEAVEVDVNAGQSVTVDLMKRGKKKGTLTLSR